jgi:hypothetical protein
LNQFQKLTKKERLQVPNQEPRNLVSATFEKDLHGLVSTCDKILDQPGKPKNKYKPPFL